MAKAKFWILSFHEIYAYEVVGKTAGIMQRVMRSENFPMMFAVVQLSNTFKYAPEEKAEEKGAGFGF